MAQGFPAPSGHLVYSQATIAVLDQLCRAAHRASPARNRAVSAASVLRHAHAEIEACTQRTAECWRIWTPGQSLSLGA